MENERITNLSEEDGNIDAMIDSIICKFDENCAILILKRHFLVYGRASLKNVGIIVVKEEITGIVWNS